jgi:hypothetical protein
MHSSLPDDLYGLPLTTSAEAAALYNDALGRVLRLESDPHEPLVAAVALDPDFALGHLALGVLSHEFGTDDQTVLHLRRAQSLKKNTTPREHQFIDAYAQRAQGNSAPLLSYLLDHPRDVLGVSVAIPTIAFSGAYDVADDAWTALEEMAAHFENDWWYDGMLAFARQDQGRMAEARVLAERSLLAEPRGGNAAHAAAHIYLETGEHEAGLRWIDGWIAAAGQDAAHRCHYSWHAALFELAVNDTDAVAARYLRELAPPLVTGPRALIDTASLIARCAIEDGAIDDVDLQVVLLESDVNLTNPPTPFMAFHCGLGLAQVADRQRLTELAAAIAAWEPKPVRCTLLTFTEALVAHVDGDHSRAADLLLGIHHQLTPIGGSYAQRSVAIDLAIASLCAARRGAEAATLIEDRLARRPRPRDLLLLERARNSI